MLVGGTDGRIGSAPLVASIPWAMLVDGRPGTRGFASLFLVALARSIWPRATYNIVNHYSFIPTN